MKNMTPAENPILGGVLHQKVRTDGGVNSTITSAESCTTMKKGACESLIDDEVVNAILTGSASDLLSGHFDMAKFEMRRRDPYFHHRPDWVQSCERLSSLPRQ